MHGRRQEIHQLYLFTPGCFRPGGGNPVLASSVNVAPINQACQSSNNTCLGLSFTANWAAIGGLGDAAINFAVIAPTPEIIDAELGLSGATGLANDTAIYSIGTSLGGSLLGQRTVIADMPRAALTFAGTPPTPEMAVFVADDLNVPEGSAASDIDKQFSQTGTNGGCTNCMSDSEEPGSVIVFPKFIQGTVSTSEGTSLPITELEIGVVCPKGVICPEHEPVKIRFHWVCGTNEANVAGIFICQETNFDINATVFEKIVLTPNGENAGFYTTGGLNNSLPSKFSPAANCPNGGGYLIAWVINPANDQPIKFDGLIGDAHLRPGSPAGGGAFAGSALARRTTMRSRSRRIPIWPTALPLRPTPTALSSSTAQPVITRRSPARSWETSGTPTSRPVRPSPLGSSLC